MRPASMHGGSGQPGSPQPGTNQPADHQPRAHQPVPRQPGSPDPEIGAARAVAIATGPTDGTSPSQRSALSPPTLRSSPSDGNPAADSAVNAVEAQLAGTGAAANGEAASDAPGLSRSACTAPQLKRFIKSRIYVPIHELRRRFQINGGDDEVTVIQVGGERLYVGLPDREGRLLGELLRGGDVGYELSLDPPTPIVVGLYPMRPIPRP
jgi:hypothetical protein